MAVTQMQHKTARGRRQYLTHGLIGLGIHAAVSLIIGTYVFVLVLFKDLGQDVALGLFGTIVGAHVTAAAGAQLHGRSTDPPDE